MSEGTTDETTVTIGDDDDPRVTVGFGAYTYEIAEGSTRVFIVALNGDPERTISVPVVIAANQGGATSADYSGVPTSVTFNAGQTSRPFTFNATDDTVDDDGESVKLGFGALPPRVSLGARNETTVTITDDDNPHVTVQFTQADYTVIEGSNAGVRVTLSAAPERTVVIPIAAANQDGATAADYSVPASVTFAAGETEKTFTFAAEDDDVDDFGESVKLTFGTTLPDRITRGAIQETTVNIWQFTALDCNAALLCADVSFADRTALDWGWYDLRYQASWDPASSITEDSFNFSGVRYTIHRIRLAPGVYPEMDNPWSRSLQDEAVLSFSIGHGASLTPPSQDHYRDWVLYLDDVTLPLSQATRFGRDFQWHGSAIQQIFADWTSSEPNRIGIMNIPFADQPQAVPPGVPRLAHADWSGDDATTVSWWAPRHDGGSAVTGYKVQWKEAGDSWTDAAAVSEKPADSMTSLTGRAKVGGLKSGALYTVRVIATNAVGDGHPSAEMIARTEGSPPRVTGAAVNGRTLTLSYDKAMDTGSAPANSSFVVLVNDGIRLVDSVSIAGSAVTLTLSSAVTADDEVTWSYQEPVVSTETALLDVDGNYAIDEERLSFHAVANETPRSSLQPLTAQFANVPASHDGAASFTFNIEFSESVWIGTGFPRDDLLRVTGGTVTSAHWLNRLTEEWSVTIRPETQGAITVVLPKQRYCVVVLSPGTREADLVSGAPCAAGDRQLSNQPEATITGPTSQQQAANNPATGAPTINGTARAGETLTATTTGISDSDGLAGATFTHQWLADDVAIDGATGSSYTVTDGDVGKAIKVRVSFTDNAGNAENLTSAATTAVTSPALRLQAAAVDGAALSLTYNNDLDEGVTLPASAFTVTVAGNTRSVSSVSVDGRAVTLTLASAVESGEAVTVSYARPDGSSFIRDTQGNRAGSFSGETATNNTAGSTDTSQRSDSSEPEAQAPGAPRNLRAATGNSGELAVSWDAPSNDGGAEITGYRVQWKESSGSWDTPANVSETTVTGTAHTITGLTDGTEYSVRVRAVNSEGAGEASPEAAATPVNPTPLTAEFLDIPESHDGSNAFTFELRFSGAPVDEFSYTTLRDHAFTVTGGEVDNVRRLEAGKNVRWEITFTPDADADVTIALNATTDCSAEGAICTSDNRMLSGGPELVVPGPPSNSPATGAPTINGTARAGETLTATTTGISDANGLASAAFSYQWLADDADISGATGNTYSVSDGDVGKAIRVRVSFTDNAGNAENLTSAATTAVRSPGAGGSGAGRPAEPEGRDRQQRGTGRLLGCAQQRRQVGDHRLPGAVEGVPGELGHPGQRVGDDRDRNDSHHHRADRRDGVRRTGAGGQLRGAGEASPEAAATPVNPTPLTAEFLDTPESHDGQNAFIFELRFSEEFILSYKTLRDHAFTVTGGEVSKVRRLEAGKNVRWEITVQPSSNTAVTIALPITTDCTVQGAICTGDGRKLSSRVELTISGPSGYNGSGSHTHKSALGRPSELHRRPPYAHGVFEELFKALLHKLMTGEVGMRELDLGAFGGHTC